MTSSSKTLRVPLALQSSKQEPDTPYDSPRHSLPSQKTSMMRRFLRTSSKDTQTPTVQVPVAPTPLDPKPECIQSPSLSSLSTSSAAPSETIDGPLPSTLSTKTASLVSPKVLAVPQQQGSLTRVKQSLTRKINARRVGAEPRSPSCTTPSHSPRESTSSVSSTCEAHSATSSPRPSTDSHTQSSAADPVLDRKQSKLKRWQTRSAHKLKTWLNGQPAQRELSSANSGQIQPAITQQALESAPATPLPDLEVQSLSASDASDASDASNAGNRSHCDTAHSLVVSEDLLPLSGPILQDLKLQHRRRASEHHPSVYSAALQTLRDDYTPYYRPLRSSSRRSLDGPGRIPVRSSSLPRSFSATSSASWTRQPLEQPEQGHFPNSPSEPAAPYTTLDNILEDSIEAAVMDSASSEAPVAVESEAMPTSCAVSMMHPFDSADDKSMPQSLPFLNQDLQEATLILSAWVAASASTWTQGRTLLDPSMLNRKRRHCKARRLSDISILVAKMPRRVHRESKRRGGWAACPRTLQSDSLGANEGASKQTEHDPTDSASLCSAAHGAKRASIAGNPAQEEEQSSSSEVLETHQPPSVPTGVCALDGSYPTHRADLVSNCEIPCGIVTGMLFSVNPLLKARWQPKSTVYALSAIGFWSSMGGRESLAV